MFPGGFFQPTFFPPGYWPRNGQAGAGAGGVTAAGAGRRYVNYLLSRQHERSVLDGIRRHMERALTERYVRQQALWELDKLRQKQVTEAAIWTVALSEV